MQFPYSYFFWLLLVDYNYLIGRLNFSKGGRGRIIVCCEHNSIKRIIHTKCHISTVEGWNLNATLWPWFQVEMLMTSSPEGEYWICASTLLRHNSCYICDHWETVSTWKGGKKMSAAPGCYIKKKKWIMEEDGWSKSITAEANRREHQTYQHQSLGVTAAASQSGMHMRHRWVYFKALCTKRPVASPECADVCSHFFFFFSCVSRSAWFHFFIYQDDVSIDWAGTYRFHCASDQFKNIWEYPIN